MSWRDSQQTARPASARRGAARRAVAASLIVAILCVAALAPGAGIPGKAPSRLAYPTTLPAGPGQEIAERSCLVCHSAMLVTQQAKDSTGWEKTITQMETWSVPLPPAERDTLRGYLLTHFGPRASAPR